MPYSSPEKNKAWYQANKERIALRRNAQYRKYYYENKPKILEKLKTQYRKNKENILEERRQKRKVDRRWIETRKKYFQENPWLLTLQHIKRRCEYPNARGYKSYGGKGIKNFLTSADLKFLWFRDNGMNLLKPSIDRIDPCGDYALENCQYIELSENVRKRLEARR